MGHETVERREFISRIGIFFVLMGLFVLMIFISTDTIRAEKNRSLKQTNTAFALEARRTYQAGVQIALTQRLPTPSLVTLDSARATQEYIAYGVQALQTRDSEAQALPTFLPSPTLIHPDELKHRSEKSNYFSLFCLGTLAISAGVIILVVTRPPRKSAGRFEGLRKWQQKQRETKEKRATAKKEREAKAKSQ